MRKKIITAGILLLLLSPPVIGLAFLSSLEPEELVIACVTDSFHFPRSVATLYLLSTTPDPTFRTHTGQTILQFTLAGWDEGTPPDDLARLKRIARHQIEGGVPIDAPGAMGLAPLHDAVLANDPEQVTFLLAHGARKDVLAGKGKFKGMTPAAFGKMLKQKNKELDLRAVLRLLEQPPQ